MSVIKMFSSFVEKQIEKINAYGSAVNTIDMVNHENKIFTMKPNQEHVYTNHRDSMYFILQQPPGAGKSTTVGFCMAYRLSKDPNAKVVIAVPQTFIAKSFGKVILRFPGEDIEWDISNNFCEQSNFSKTTAIVNFLRKDVFPEGIHNRIAITTHMSLANAAARLMKAPEVFKNTTFIFDEGHHVLYPVNGDAKYCNKIGKLVQSILESNNPTSSIWLTTATFYRGDKGSIIPDELMDKFDRHFLPLDQHWKENIKHIEEFNLDFVVYKNNDVSNEVKELFINGGKRKTIIYCPYTGSQLNGLTKYRFRDKLIKTIKDIWPECNIMDLITVNGRSERKKLMLDNTTAKDVDIVLSIRLFDEGSDWIFAEQIMDLVPSDSLRIMNQRFGRLWRDFPGKKRVSYFMFLPFEAKFKDEEERRLHLSKSYAALVASMLLHEIIEPIKYPAITKKVKKINPKTNEVEEVIEPEVTVNPFEMEVPDENKRRDIINNVTKDLMFLANINETPSYKEVNDCIRNTLTNNGIENNQDDIIKHITLMLRRQSELMNPQKPKWDISTVDVQWVVESGFDKIWSNDILDNLLLFGTGVSNINTFKDFREVYNQNRKSYYEWIKIAEQLAEENGGKLPAPSILIKTGYQSLVSFMGPNKELFEHIEKESFNKSIDEWVEYAEQLAEENGGKLPTATELYNNHPGLINTMYDFPDSFNHIKRTYLTLTGEKHKTLKEWVNFAEQLAKDNGGKLPTITDLRENGYVQLTALLYRHPDKFKHIPRRNLNAEKHKTVSEWVKFAEQLVKEYGGTLPKIGELQKLGYTRLTTVMRKNVNRFKHIPQIRTYPNRKTVDEWVKVAEQLAKDNGGKLQDMTYLKANGYYALTKQIYNNPEKFKHIQQHNLNKERGKSNKEMVKLAEQLAEEYGGTLPNTQKLAEAGYYALVNRMRYNPEYFKHIPQHRVFTTRRTVDEWIKITKDLLKKYNGILPSVSWLTKNNYKQLVKIIHRYPERFKGIKQEVLNSVGKFSHIRIIGEN